MAQAKTTGFFSPASPSGETWTAPVHSLHDGTTGTTWVLVTLLPALLEGTLILWGGEVCKHCREIHCPLCICNTRQPHHLWVSVNSLLPIPHLLSPNAHHQCPSSRTGQGIWEKRVLYAGNGTPTQRARELVHQADITVGTEVTNAGKAILILSEIQRFSPSPGCHGLSPCWSHGKP